MNKIALFVFLAIQKNIVIILTAWQRSSVVEQRNHNPLVGGPNPSAATRIQAGFIPVLILSDKGLRIRYFSTNKRI